MDDASTVVATAAGSESDNTLSITQQTISLEEVDPFADTGSTAVRSAAAAAPPPPPPPSALELMVGAAPRSPIRPASPDKPRSAHATPSRSALPTVAPSPNRSQRPPSPPAAAAADAAELVVPPSQAATEPIATAASDTAASQAASTESTAESDSTAAAAQKATTKATTTDTDTKAEATASSKPTKTRAEMPVYDEDDSGDEKETAKTTLRESTKSHKKQKKSKSRANPNVSASSTSALVGSKALRGDSDSDDGDWKEEDVSNGMDVETRASARSSVADTEAGVEGEDPNAEESDEELKYAELVRDQHSKQRDEKLKQAKLMYEKYIVPLSSSRVLSADEAAKVALMAHMKAGRAKVVEMSLATPALTVSEEQKRLRKSGLSGLKEIQRAKREQRLAAETGVNADGTAVDPDAEGENGIVATAAKHMSRVLAQIASRKKSICTPSIMAVDRGEVVIRKVSSSKSGASTPGGGVSRNRSGGKPAAAATPTSTAEWVLQQTKVKRESSGLVVFDKDSEWVPAPKLNKFDIMQSSCTPHHLIIS